MDSYVDSTVTTIYVIVLALSYLISIYPLYTMYKRANLKNPWVAFIPIFGGIKSFNLANFSMWWYLLAIIVSCIPILGGIAVIIFSCYCSIKTCKNFGLGTLGAILSIFFGIFVYWYIVLTDKQFIAQLNPKFTNDLAE